MKKLLLVASLCVVAAAVMPIASASAALTGTCKIAGSAKFKPAELSKNPAKLEYEFTSKEIKPHGVAIPGVECNGKPGGEVTVKPGKVEASCTGLITEVQNEADGVGEIKGLPAGLGGPYTFDLDVTGSALGIVNVKIEKKGEANPEGVPEAVGAASFFLSEIEPAAKCLTSGVKELEFIATQTGSIE